MGAAFPLADSSPYLVGNLLYDAHTAILMANIIHGHPTPSEAMLDAANAVFGMPINT